MINKDPIYHPKPQKGSRAVQMGKKMTQNGTKNNLKQPQTTKSVFGSFHQFGYPNHHNINFHTVFGSFFVSPDTAGFSFSYLQPTFPQNLHQRGGIPHKSEFQNQGAQLLFSV